MIEQHIEQRFIDKLTELKYEYRSDITDRAALEKNFREKFEALNRVRLTDSEFARLLDEIVTPDVFTAAKTQLDQYTDLIGKNKAKRTNIEVRGTSIGILTQAGTSCAPDLLNVALFGHTVEAASSRIELSRNAR